MSNLKFLVNFIPDMCTFEADTILFTFFIKIHGQAENLKDGFFFEPAQLSIKLLQCCFYPSSLNFHEEKKTELEILPVLKMRKAGRSKVTSP